MLWVCFLPVEPSVQLHISCLPTDIFAAQKYSTCCPGKSSNSPSTCLHNEHTPPLSGLQCPLLLRTRQRGLDVTVNARVWCGGGLALPGYESLLKKMRIRMSPAAEVITMPAILKPNEIFPWKTAPSQSYDETCRDHRENITASKPTKNIQKFRK